MDFEKSIQVFSWLWSYFEPTIWTSIKWGVYLAYEGIWTLLGIYPFNLIIYGTLGLILLEHILGRFTKKQIIETKYQLQKLRTSSEQEIQQFKEELKLFQIDIKSIMQATQSSSNSSELNKHEISDLQNISNSLQQQINRLTLQQEKSHILAQEIQKQFQLIIQDIQKQFDELTEAETN